MKQENKKHIEGCHEHLLKLATLLDLAGVDIRVTTAEINGSTYIVNVLLPEYEENGKARTYCIAYKWNDRAEGAQKAGYQQIATYLTGGYDGVPYAEIPAPLLGSVTEKGYYKLHIQPA